MEKIVFENFCFGKILKSKELFSFDGQINFFSDNEDTLQIGAIKRNKNDNIQPHYHTESIRNIEKTSEVLIIISGVIKINFYNINNLYVGHEIANKGDIVYLNDGGHGIEIIEESKIIEIKQGPNLGDKDKIKFNV